jgi:iron(III) transport system ATP-binding protein
VAVELENVTISYGDVTAVEGFDLVIEEGEMLVLLGPSGCGKTSVMRSIAGLEEPTGGRITIEGKVVFDHARGIDVPVNKRHVAMVFQSYAIWPHMSVEENVAFPLKVARKMNKAQMHQRALEVLRTVGLEEFAARPASRLSGGQMQRVALARSIAMNPYVMLLDEPLSNLDAKMRDRLRFELKELHDRLGITALYVTHDLSEALALGDRVAVMNEGRIIQLGTPREVYAHPNSAFVADFLGIANVFPGSVTEVRDGESTVWLEGGVAVRGATEGASGDKVLVCLPPERLTVRRRSTTGLVNEWKCEVVTANFLGAQTRYKVRSEAGLVLDAVQFGRDEGLDRGDTAYLSVDPRDVLTLPAGAGA